MAEPTDRSSVGTSAVFVDSDSPPPGPVAQLLWDLVSPLIWRMTVVYTKLFIVLASIGIFASTAVMLYSLVYWLVVPKQLHSFPVFFDYAANANVVACANVTLAFPQWNGLGRPNRVWDSPQSGFEYDISLSFDFPRTSHNSNLEPVMISTSVLTEGGTIEAAPAAYTKRPLMLVHTSVFASVFRDILWMTVSGLGVLQDSHNADVTLIESFPVLAQESVSQVNICMSPPIHVYSASLNFVSKLSGLMYLIAHYPILSGIAVVTIAVLLSILTVLGVAFLRKFYPNTFKSPTETNHTDASDHESIHSFSSGEDLLDSGAGRSPRNSHNSIRRRSRH